MGEATAPGLCCPLTQTRSSSSSSVLHYSFTLQLNFPSLLFLFVCLIVAGFVWLRYRHLNRYERLREVPLTKDEGFNLHPDVARGSDENERGSFHNYLDDFLQAIRIFGFLEKPVFHELARHLQTRRLVAGDSISLDSDSSFYIVVDGHVQVFAPLPTDEGATRAADEFEDEEHSGFQLLNEVESGGTLSSLFTILRLFTEDVHLPSGDDEADVTGVRNNGLHPQQEGHNMRRRGSRYKTQSDEAQSATLTSMRPGSNQLQLNAATLRNIPSAAASTSHFGHNAVDEFLNSGTQRKAKGSVMTDDESTINEATHGASQPPSLPPQEFSSTPSDALPPAQAEPPFHYFGASNGSTASKSRHPGSLSPPLRNRAPSTATEGRPLTPGSILSNFSGPLGAESKADASIQDELGTIGRATVDTTLAVIPAVAFKRLTKKYPNAAAHIVQVILTRLSRVTFHTAHKYLGLTREVMRTEKNINESACYTLPSAFYEQGGMERLRQRFLPEPQRKQQEKAEGHDRPAQTPVSAKDRRGTNSTVMSDASTGTARQPSTGDYFSTAQLSEKEVDALKGPRAQWGRTDYPVRTPISRSSVGPGDLLSMTGTEEHGRPNSPFQDLLGSPKPHAPKRLGSQSTRDRSGSFISARPSYSGHNIQDQSHDSSGTQRARNKTSDGGEPLFGISGLSSNVDLKDAIMGCIAKSIGLAQAPQSPPISMQASPFLHPQDQLQRSVFKSAFGSLSMLDAAMYDDESSATGHSSSLVGAHPVELENEVEIRFFEAGSYLARATERQAGLFYVIDGFLDIIVPTPEDELPREASAQPNTGSQQPPAYPRTSENLPRRAGRATNAPKASAFEGNSLDGTQHGHNSRKTKEARLKQAASRLHTGQGQRPMYSVGRGGMAGYLSSLLGTASYIDVRAKTDVYVGFLPGKALERMMERRPSVLLTLCKRLLSLLSPLILHIDSALDWQQVNAGQIIFRENDPADSFYIVINGRLRSITEKRGSGVDVLDEYGQGDSVGELDVITRSPRRKTLHAIRDSELAKMPMTLFNAISVRHPAITIQISRIIAKRVRDEVGKRGVRDTMPLLQAPVPGLPDLGRNNQNLKTVAILPVTRHVPIVDFSNRLQQAFEDTIGGPTAFLNQSSVMGILGRHAFNRMGKLKLAGWLAEQEQKYRLVLYVVDTAVSSPWAQTSIRQADCVLLIGFGDDPSMGEYERLLLGVKTTARKELVLLHPERSVPPGSTREWLKTRPWINAHHHVELPGLAHSARSTYPSTAPFGDPTAVKALRNLKAKLETSLQRYRSKTGQPIAGRPVQCSDFARLARRLCGRSIGVVLGGGGARGCAHVGFLQALEERGIPVDMVGGTSIGSLVGGLYAKEAEMVSSFGRVKKFAARTASLWRFVLDLTYPVCSYTSGFEFNRGVFKALGETHIEDMWLPFFCNTTNITWSRMEVHTSGYSWRYIRGSMTLAGLIPPLVDEGHMLVDGGYMDNLPVSVMFAMGARDVFAVDVGSIDDTSPRSYGDTLSGWWVVLNRYNPWSDARNIPSITDIQGRLTYVSSVKTLEEAKKTPGCLYLRMPVESFGTMEFGKFNEISELGYQAASRALEDWSREAKLPTAYEVSDEHDELRKRRRRGGISARRNSV